VLFVLAACALGLAPFSFNHYLRANAWVLAPVICSEQLRGLTVTLCSVFRGFQKMIYEVIVVGCERLAVLGGVLWMFWNGHGVGAAAWAFFGGRLAVLGLAAVVLRWKIGAVQVSLRPRLARELLRESFPLAVLQLAERINLYFAPIALTAIAGEYAAGLFQSAFKIVTFPVMLAGAVGGSLFPAMSAAHGDAVRVQRLYRLGVRVLWHALLPGAVVTLAFAAPAVRIIFGAEFVPAAPVLEWLTPYYALYAMITVSYYLMPAVNEQRVTLWLSLTSLGLNLALGPLFIWWLGARGAAMALVVTNAVIALAYWRRAARLGYHVLRGRHELGQWLGFAIALTAAFALRRFFAVEHWYELLLAAVAVTAVYAAALVITRSVLPEEAELVAAAKKRLAVGA
jgi:O-antigen/teichoic acid export membrane protein